MSLISSWIQKYTDSKQPAYPTADYPIIIKGEISGNQIRCESINGGEMYLTQELVSKLVIAGIEFRDDSVCLNNVKPFMYEGKMWGITHLQKQSHHGYLKTDPDCYHLWTFFRRQQTDAKGNWIPGTELGFYYRKPFSWRWDVVGTVINKTLRHWIWTKGYVGGHYD